MKKMLLLVSGVLMLGACAMVPTHAGSALIEMTDQPVLVTNAIGTKTGKACAKNYFGIYLAGDMTIEAAKRNGRITQVATVDTQIKGYAIYAEVCTIVTGR